MAYHKKNNFMTPEYYMQLYEKYLLGSCTPEEEELLMRYQDNFKLRNNNDELLSAADKKLRADIYSRIHTSAEENNKPRSIKFWWWLAAAAILCGGLIFGGLLIKKQREAIADQTNIALIKKNPIKPGANTAILTLANGISIALDKVGNGVVAKAGNTAIRKMKNGLLAYTTTTGDNKGAIVTDALNTITIPRGGQYTITLPDGTSVWLNSQSSLTFPVAFKGSERRVSLTGEAYFEVAKNRQMPFIVHTGNADVKVLGTHFNVKAYQEDNAVKTTLLEGSVSLSNSSSSALLVPGEQGIAEAAGGKITQKKVNINQVMAWKSGYFIFREDDIHDIMKQISRWYDVDVEYRSNVSNIKFGGTYSKNKDINELLKGLELTGLVHFKIEGRRIIVMT
ncbi:FecR family protein [Mucilaginibacter lappiensis]|uniref:Ferric-dicitrate binding protein FerR (Iron transport regulator) n=2 Tax=Mucilaginibacter lappiensis TaxID=354630 RepID=A0A841JAR9_9SPHI|nr:FecR family protein [Mucilaginibacter lappiensis]MBB6109972.1 ferric-dicitrate binding protein FerR (iron transport regulator) [Mucilaginibacter lappiensis]MBB6126686.1 ferric-dicitrate binding protein FerR (iron transport regulator) [Mucilaginibacter lappiensis]